MNKALFSVVFAVAVVAGLSGCSPAPDEQHTSQAANSACAFSQKNASAPDWLCTGIYDEAVLTATGSAAIGDGGLPLAKQEAIEQAKQQLSQLAVQESERMVGDLLDKAGYIEAHQREPILQLIREHTGSESISRAELFTMATSPQQQLYVLIGLNDYGLRKTKGFGLDLIRTEMPEVWQQIRNALASEA